MKVNNILITGGNGFIGSQVARKLHASNQQITIVDTAWKDWSSLPEIKFVQEDYLYYLKHSPSFDTIIHLAAEHKVSESVMDPQTYYEKNVVNMKKMLDYTKSSIKNIIFSSTGNVYGKQGEISVCNEDMLCDPENPYASSKLAGEYLIKDYAHAYGFKYLIFRFFNVAGADPNGIDGYTQSPATHVIPVLCKSVLNGSPFYINSYIENNEYKTCIRDYVHVDDVATAHKKAIEFFYHGNGNEVINLGGGSNGINICDMVNYIVRTNKKITTEYKPYRLGDPKKLVADITKAKRVLNWAPKYNIEAIIEHALKWEIMNEESK